MKSRKIKLRKITRKDYNDVTALQLLCFPEMKTWSKEQFDSIMNIFPEGQFLIEYDNKIVASCCSLIIKRSDYSENASWGELTNHGFITNHDPDGDTLYGIEIMVDPEYRQMKLSRRLYQARKELARQKNLKAILIGGRIPNYHKYAGKMSVQDYIEDVINRKLFDPVLTAQSSNGFVLKRILPDYLPNDKESLGYGTFLEWSNVHYHEDASKSITHRRLVKICCVQYKMRMINNFREFADHCEYFVDVASDYRSDFVLFPEMLTMQLLSFMPHKRPGRAVRELSRFTEQYQELFRTLSIKYNTNIIGGSHFQEDKGDLFNISYMFKRDGTMEQQYKLHITPHEKKWWGLKPGNGVNIIQTDRGKIAILICYDIEFPELARIAVHQGAQIIFVPFNTDERRAFLRVKYCAQARAVENQVYVAIAGCVGNLPKVENLDIHFAQSAIFTPSDIEFSREAIATQASENTEMVIFQELDLNLLARNRVAGSVQMWKDRRTDVYSISYNKDSENEKITF